jgi:hypothetical protein
MVSAPVIFRLWSDGGFIMYPITAAFLAAVAMLCVQLALSRKTRFPHLLPGWIAVILGLGTLGMSVGYRLVVDIVGQQSQPNSGVLLREHEIASIPVFFALAMVAFLLFLQIITNAIGGDDAFPAVAMVRLTRLLGSLGILSLFLGLIFGLRGAMTMSGLMAPEGVNKVEIADTLIGHFVSSMACSLVAVLFGLATVALSIAAGFLHTSSTQRHS